MTFGKAACLPFSAIPNGTAGGGLNCPPLDFEAHTLTTTPHENLELFRYLKKKR